MRRSRFAPLASALVALASSSSFAMDNDFRLDASRLAGTSLPCPSGARPEECEGVLFRRTASGFEPKNEVWRAFVGELGFVLSPRIASPADTLGHAGFHVGALWSGSMVSEEREHWGVTERGRNTGTPAAMLHTLELEVKKGLPLSFEAGANVMWLVDSQIFAPGLELRWALYEGFAGAPDLGVRGSVNQMIGNRDMTLTMVGFDLVVSKGFGVAGVVSLTPYVSWSFLFFEAASRIVDPTPTDWSDPQHDFVFDPLGLTSDLHHKLTFGLRTLWDVVDVSVQGELQMFEGSGVVGPVANITAKLGLDY